MGTQELLNSGQSTIVRKLSNISLSYNFTGHYVSPFLQKETVKKIVIKGLNMLEFRTKGTCQRSCLYLLPSFYKLFFLMLKSILKNKIIIQHPSAEPEKVLQ